VEVVLCAIGSLIRSKFTQTSIFSNGQAKVIEYSSRSASDDTHMLQETATPSWHNYLMRQFPICALCIMAPEYISFVLLFPFLCWRRFIRHGICVPPLSPQDPVETITIWMIYFLSTGHPVPRVHAVLQKKYEGSLLYMIFFPSVVCVGARSITSNGDRTGSTQRIRIFAARL